MNLGQTVVVIWRQKRVNIGATKIWNRVITTPSECLLCAY